MSRTKTAVKTKTTTTTTTTTKTAVLEARAVYCAQCGKPMFVDLEGVSRHAGDSSDGVDYDADADHTPYAEWDSEDESTQGSA